MPDKKDVPLRQDRGGLDWILEKISLPVRGR